MDETQLLLSRVEDLIRNRGYEEPQFLGFLNEHEAAICSAYLNNRHIDFTLFGGYKNATRVYLAVDECSFADFPITALLISSHGTNKLGHRDYLGSVMGMGIKRECVGDIVLINDKDAVIFVRTEIADYLKNQLQKVRNDYVKVSDYSGNTDALCSKTEQLRLIVTSMRVDNIVSSCINTSRNTASELISSDSVFVNHLQIHKPSQLLSSGDVLSIRGYGKYVIGDVVGKTKRDRTVINVLHYI